MAQRYPDFFIAGAPRCGTTFLYDVLMAHPRVFMPLIKEPHFFAPDLVFRQAVTDRDAYLALFKGAAPNELVGEASAEYLASKAAARAIAGVRPQARSIISLRDPIERIVSMHSLKVFQGTEQRALNDLVREDLDAGPASGHQPLTRARRYTLGSLYGQQLVRWFEHFPREHVLVILLDDLSASALGTVNRILAFLALEPFAEMPTADDIKLSRKAVRKAQRKAIAVEDQSRLRASLASVRRKLVSGNGNGGGSKAAAASSTSDDDESAEEQSAAERRSDRRNPRKKEELDPAIRAELQERLLPDLELASSLIGMDLVTRWWGSRPLVEVPIRTLEVAR